MTPTLIVLIPLLVVPVVALLAFAGCKPFAADTSTPPGTAPGNGDHPGNGNGNGRPSYADTILKGGEGLVAYWTLSDVATTVAVDKGPSALNGTYRGAPVLGQGGGALADREPSDGCTRFGGADLVEVPHSALLNPGPNLRFTFEIWVRHVDAAGHAGDTQTIASSRGKAGGDDTGWELYLSYGNDGTPTYKARVFGGGTNASATMAAGAGAVGGAWHLVALIYDGTGAAPSVTVDIRIVGDPNRYTETKSPAGYASTTDASPFVIAAFGAGNPQRPFTGDLDEAAFYNTALSPTQIDAHVAASRP
ncbi:LamG-like jellyroll fold domain-containing protein [Aquihabitans sp. McL0605]|uniref:LamG-like jellyroll fold domain-containing protein n=1 Tax=Aquihabitans sp. McL0605 TaxID=3415671 RepID=UPI003CE9D274